MYKCTHSHTHTHTPTAASVTLPIEARQYMRLLVDQCMLRFFVAVKARETGQLFLKVCIHTYMYYTKPYIMLVE